jgi:hypothetical protein
MPIYSVQGPDGRIYDVEGPAGASEADIISAVKRQIASTPKPAEPTVGGQVKEFFKGLAPGAIGLVESAATGASALLPEETEKRAREGIASLAKTAKAPFAAAPGYEETIGRKFGEAAGSIVPFLGLGPLGVAGRVGMAALGTGAGAGEARTRAEQEGATAEQRATATGLGSVVGISEMFAPMRILGRIDEPIKQGIAASLKRVALAGGEEAAQEAAAQAAQNLIAKGIYKPEQAIIEQVGESAAYGGAVGALAQGLLDMALGRRARGTGTQEEIAKAREEAEAARAAEEARKADPGYARQFVTDYEARKAEFITAKNALKKPGKDATPDVWDAYREQKKAVDDIRESLTKDAKEYNKLRGVVAPELEAEKIQAELARLRSEAKGQTILPGFESETVTSPAEPQADTEFVDYAKQVRDLKARMEDLASQAQQTTDLAQKRELSRQYGMAQTALTEAEPLAAQQVAKQKKEAADPTKRLQTLAEQMRLAEENGDLVAQGKIADKLEALGVTDLSQIPAKGTPPVQGEIPLEPFKSKTMTRAEAAAQFYKPGAPDIEAQESALLEEQRLADEQARADALREIKIAPEAVALQRIAQRPAGLTNITAGLNAPDTTPRGSTAMAVMNQRLRLESGLSAAREKLAKAQDLYKADPTPFAEKRLEAATAELEAAQNAYDASRQEMLQQELIPTAEETTPPTAPVVRKAPSEGFKLRPSQGAPVRPSSYQDLSTRLASALARDDIDQRTYDFLRRAENVLPSIDARIETARTEPAQFGEGPLAKKGAAKDIASTEGFLTLLDKQLDLIERGQEGVITGRRYLDEEGGRARGSAAEVAEASKASGRDISKYRTMEQASFAAAESKKRARNIPPMPGETERVNVPGAPVSRRLEATRGTTLRMPAKPLSLAREMEPLLRLQEQLAGPDLAETKQAELFPSEARGVVRATAANFAKFLQSKEVQALRGMLPKSLADVERQRKALPDLKARVAQLQKQLDGMEEAAKEYKSAQAVLKSNKDLANVEIAISDVQRSITKNITDRITLEKQIQDLGSEIKRLEDARRDLLAPQPIVRKIKGRATPIGVGAAELVESRLRDLETNPALGMQLTGLENRVTDLRGRVQELLNERTLIDGALNRLNDYVAVVRARNKIAELQERAPFGYEMDQAKDALRAAQAAVGAIESETGKTKAQITAEQAKERRRQEAIERARKIDDSTARAKEQQKRLEAMYSQEVTGEQVQADPEAQARRMAKEMGEPDYTATEKVEVMKDPNKVLGGLLAEATRIQKQMEAAKKASLAARDAALKPLRAKLDGLESAYKVTKDSATRAALLPKIEKATADLQEAVDRQATEPLTWKGMKQQIRSLAVALNKYENLETKLGVGRVIDASIPERASPTFKPSKGEKAAAAKERQRIEAQEAAKRAGAPTTSGEALTRTEAKKAAEAEPTVYTGKGVGPDVANPMAKGKEGGEPGVFRTATKAGPSLKEQTVKDITDKVMADWAVTPDVQVVADESGLPENIRAQAEAQGKTGQIPGLYDPNTKTVYLVASGLKDTNDVVLTIAHEVTGHFGLREMLGAAYTKNMNRLYDGNKLVKERADAKMEEDPKLSREVAVEEVLADMAEIGATPQERNILQRVYDFVRRWLANKFPSFNMDTVTENEVKQIVANARRYVIEGEGKIEGGTAKTDGLLYRTAKYASPEMEAAGNALDPFVSKYRGNMEKVKANATGLAFETQLVDRFAGFERLAKYLPEHMGTQMMYYLRMYDQRMNMVSQAVAAGAPSIVEKKRPDGKTERIIEAKEGPNIKNVVEILKDANPMVGNAEAVNRLFTAYMAAIRADNKGFESLNFGEDVTRADLDKALSVVENNKELKAIFDKARGEYNEYNRNLIKFLVETGALSKKVAERLTAENDYIPFYREQNGVAQLLIGGEAPIRIGSIKEQPYLKELVGGDQPILDFLTSSVQNTNMLVDMGMRNLATKNAVFELINLNAAKLVKGTPSGKDVVKFKIDGDDRYAVLATETVTIGNKTFDTGVPADILVKGMEGIPTQMPFIFRAMAMPAQLLRKGVTLSPLYMARQLFRDSLAAPILSGANFTPVLGALRQIGAPAGKTLERRGITGGQQFKGTSEDLSMILREVASGKPGWMTALGKFEAAAMEADALTRRAQYNSYINQGLSEMEATLMSLESMNFNKRGASPSIHIANALIPFFNAQIQGLNVLYKAMFGKMPFNDKLKIRQKMLQRGGMMAVASMVYAMMMEDDEAYQNAEPDQKYGNWFVRLPGVDEPVRVPIPFEVGYIFKALPEALVNSLNSEHGGEEAIKAFKQIILQTIPGGSSYGIPQAYKPAIEVGLGKSFYTGRDILSAREKNLLPEDQFRANTTEIAKAFGKLTGASPILVEQFVKGYTGTMGLAFLQALSMGVPTGESPEKAVKRLSEYPVIGGAFQPNDAGGIINSVYERMNDAEKVANTYKDMVKDGRTAEAEALLQRRGNDFFQAEIAKEFKANMNQLSQAERAIQASDMTGEEKRKQLDEIRKLKIAVAKEIRDVADKTVSLSFSL